MALYTDAPSLEELLPYCRLIDQTVEPTIPVLTSSLKVAELEWDGVSVSAVEDECARLLEFHFQMLHAKCTYVSPPVEPITGELGDVPPEVHRVVMGLLFMMQVVMPCFVLYQVAPDELLASARSGDLKAIAKLLHLDDIIVTDPEISAHIFTNPKGLALLRQQLTSSPKIEPNDCWKARLAALIHTRAQEMNSPLSYDDIANLFHALAMDCDGSERGDESIRFLGERSFARRAQREKKYWQ